jgi:hypothetical protein
MEERAEALGKKGILHYLFPQNNGLNSTDAMRAAKLNLGTQLGIDIHYHATGAVELAEANFPKFPEWGEVNLETNCGEHTHWRGLQEAADLLDFFNNSDARLQARTGSFCFERSGYNEAGANDQVCLQSWILNLRLT